MTTYKHRLAIWIGVIHTDEIIVRHRAEMREGSAAVGRLVRAITIVDTRLVEGRRIGRVVGNPRRTIGDDIGARTCTELCPRAVYRALPETLLCDAGDDGARIWHSGYHGGIAALRCHASEVARDVYPSGPYRYSNGKRCTPVCRATGTRAGDAVDGIGCRRDGGRA